MRGNRLRCRLRPLRARSIPACAGESPFDYRRWRANRVYPRVCGGILSRATLAYPNSGLSPRVRGNPGRASIARILAGSIPACAGESQPLARADRPHKVYPRVCGGIRRLWRVPRARLGLSPRVRGNQRLPARCTGLPGSIPACAGESRRQRPGQRKLEVYPRVCGGIVALRELGQPFGGLSPRVRGNLLWHRGRRRGRGSIPACAGESPYQTSVWAREGVYPRVCGGIVYRPAPPHLLLGLSPRVRGNPVKTLYKIQRTRSIPACAGESDTELLLDKKK